MKTKNKPIEIAAAIIGGIFAAIHIIVAVYAIIVLKDPNYWQLQKPTASSFLGPGLLFVVFAEFVGKTLGFMFAVLTIGVAVFLLAAEILPLCFNNTKALRIISIVTSCLLAYLMLLEVSLFFGEAVRGFRDGNFLSGMLTTVFLLLGMGWFALSVTKAVIYKNKKLTAPEGEFITRE